MLIRTDPFRELDRLTGELFGSTRPAVPPLDAYRFGDTFVVALDLPGIDAASVDLTLDGNALTVKAERQPVAGENAEVLIAERPTGVFTRQVLLDQALDTDRIEASYDDGVLTVTIPVAEQPTPHRIEISGGDHEVIDG